MTALTLHQHHGPAAAFLSPVGIVTDNGIVGSVGSLAAQLKLFLRSALLTQQTAYPEVLFTHPRGHPLSFQGPKSKTEGPFLPCSAYARR